MRVVRPVLATILAMHLASWAPAGAAARPPAGPAIARARALEDAKKWPEASAAWERVIDTCAATEKERLQAVARLHELNPRVPPNTDPAKANVWTAKAFVFRTLDFTWTPKDATEPRHAVIRFTDDEVEHLKRRFARFAELVFEFSRGALRIAYEIEVIDEPVTRLSGDGAFWLGPWDVETLIAGRYEPGKVDSVVAHVKLSDGRGTDVPGAMLGGAFGGDLGPGGAGWTGLMWAPWILQADTDGEAELHEWLHQADWSFAARLRYPDEIVPTSDGGRMEGEEGGDPDFRRKRDEKNWLGFYRHLMGEHITSKMWHEARCRPWEGVVFGRQWRVLGPVPYEGEIGKALEASPWDPARPPRDGDRAGDLAWKTFRSDKDFIDLVAACGSGGNRVAYAAATVTCDADRDACLWLGYDDSIVAYVNGEEVYRFVGGRAAAKDDAVARVRLKRGTNLVFLKVADIAGGWGFFARLGDDVGRAVPGLTWAMPAEGGKAGP